MKKILIISSITLAGCASNFGGTEPDRPVTTKSTSDYYANETPMVAHTAWAGKDGARELLTNIEICEGASKDTEVTMGGKKHISSTKCHLELLTNSDSETYIKSLSGELKGQVLTSSLSAKGESYEVTMLWSKHTWMGSPDESGSDSAKYQIGVGAKIVAKIYNSQAGLDLADLSGLAASAEANNLTGSITFKRIGINGKLSEIILPGFTDTLDKDAVLNAVQSMQKIQLLLYSDEDVTVKPSVLGYVLPKKEEVPLDGLGWMYIGYYENDSTLNPEYKISGTKTLSQLVGSMITANSVRNIRIDRPRFPYYSMAEVVGQLQENCTVRVDQLQNVGKNKYWAYVSGSDTCGL
ncbi:hypothetical protein [Vibrio splendidus]|uniref:hypothetical protein n=1 Tax=Vibrio splendidus TaxID=29497 RepID=UPI000C8472B9|nr:hypothetical protein [Vibrio splendidus]PMK36908.1 hypothetical protein BCU01_03755 [Vibrio splendidus]